MIKDKKTIADSSAGVRTSPLLAAVYCVKSTDNFLVLIPKKKGNGYLKSCFGWQHINKAARIFKDERPTWFTNGDTCDLDGYLSIELKVRWWEKDFDKGVKEVVSALKIAFPYVNEWVEDCQLFWKEAAIK